MEFRLTDIRLPTGTVHYQVAGDGPPLACFHDSGGSVITRAIEKLAETRTVLLPIVPGFDGTPYHRSVQQIRLVHSMPGLANIMANFIEATVGAPCDVMGQSFGARLALWVAAQRADIIGRLIVQSPTGLRKDGRGGLGRDTGDIRTMLHAYPDRAPQSSRTKAELEVNRAVPSHYHQNVPFDQELVDRLRFIRSDTLILLGTEDRIVPTEVAYFLKAHIQNAHMSYIYDAAHALDSDQPDRVARIVAAFLERGPAFIVRQPAAAAAGRAESPQQGDDASGSAPDGSDQKGAGPAAS